MSKSMSIEMDWASQTEQSLLTAALPLAPRLGWTSRLVVAAGARVGLGAVDCELLLPEGPRDLAALYARRLDAKALASLEGVAPGALKVRERIREGVLAWLRAAREDESATRRWLGFLALPSHAALGLRLAWASADSLWRWAGDTATDENHYTKRTLLAEILASCLAILLTSGLGAAERHLNRRIHGVMAFERIKGRLKGVSALADQAARRLGRWRYGEGPAPDAA
jgi:ubiquinone biosynthesis protein COQ9